LKEILFLRETVLKCTILTISIDADFPTNLFLLCYKMRIRQKTRGKVQSIALVIQ